MFSNHIKKEADSLKDVGKELGYNKYKTSLDVEVPKGLHLDDDCEIFSDARSELEGPLLYEESIATVKLSDELSDFDDDTLFTQFSRSHKSENKIILGSKPSKEIFDDHESSEAEIDISLTTLKITNIQTFLDKSEKYCEDCKILFDSENNFEIHKTDIHSLLVPKLSHRNVAVKSTSKQALIRNTARKSTGPELKCNVCHFVVSKKFTLARHYEEEHKNVKISRRHKVCRHCYQQFDKYRDLIEHLYEIINSKNDNSCHKFIANNYNNIEGTTNVGKKTNSLLFMCPVCSFYVNHSDTLKTHMMTIHKQNCVNPVPVKFKDECKFCGLLNPDHEKHNSHIRTNHPKYFLKDNSQKEPMNLELCAKELKTKNLEIEGAIPKFVLFKCFKCDIYFLSCSGAIDHSENCTLSSEGTWKCLKCVKLFYPHDQIKHEAQHRFNNDFKVFVAHQKLLKMILYQCPECGINFSEKCFIEHGKTICKNETESSRCSECDILIYDKIKKIHVKRHETLKLSRNDFIILDCVYPKQTLKYSDDKYKEIYSSTPRKRINSDFKVTPIKQSKSDISKPSLKLYYCNICQCYMEVTNDLKATHLNSDCRNINYKNCEACGLTVTENDFTAHIKLHREFIDLKLLDFEFISLQDSQKINPPVPKFFYCCDCRVYFCNYNTHRIHKCRQHFYLTCAICNLKYDRVAYKIHLVFHEYSVTSQLSENSELLLSNNNILYICNECNIAVDLYDVAVEHCQNHFNNKYEVEIINCPICAIKFESISYDRHAERHKKFENVTKTSFKCLNYLYTSLVTSNWLKLFDSIPQETRNKILSNSIYKVTRCVKMNVIQNGPTELTLYRCAVCSNYVDKNFVLNHAQNVDTCSKMSQRHVCKKCLVPFYSKEGQNQHERIHDIPNINETICRIVIFNNENDRDFNKSIHIDSHPFQHKNGEANISKVNDIISPADQQKKKKDVDVVENSALNTHKYKPKKNFRFVYFQCKKCDVCVLHDRSKDLHSCIFSDHRKRRCKTCNLYFARPHYSRHRQLHEKMPSVKPKIKFFKPKKNIYKKALLPKQITDDKVQNKSINLNDEKTCKIYECSSCGLYFSTYNSIDKHSEVCGTGNSPSIEICSKCNRPFDTNSLVHHLCNQHNNFKKVMFDVIKVHPKICAALVYRCSTCLVLFPSEKSLYEHFNTNCPADSNLCTICDEKFHPSMILSHVSKHAESIDWKLCDKNIVIKDNTAENKNDSEKKKVYRCTKCNVCYITMMSFRYHFQCKHKMKRKIETCKICGLKFGSMSLNNHITIHHKENSFKREDLIVIDDIPKTKKSNASESIKVIKIKTVKKDFKPKITKINDKLSLSNINATQSSATSYDQQNNSENDSDLHVDKFSKLLYKCHKCPLHFPKFSSLSKHLSYQKHESVNIYPCNLCGLKFSTNTLRRHKEIHHQIMNLNINDFIIKIPFAYSDDSDTGLNDTSISTSDHNNQKQTVKINLNSSYSSINSKKKPIKLFKCGECNVYFITSMYLSKHVNDHSPLHPKEYVECKYCKLAFTFNCLKVHIKKHHEDDSTLEHAMIVELHPNAKDKKIVSVLKSVLSRKT